MITSPDLQPDAIRAAHLAIPRVFRDSPQFVHQGLSARLEVPVIVKVETVNPIGSFKGRGTWIAVAALAEEGRIGPDRPVVCVSAGNFGQGVAYAARALNVPAIVFCSTRANRGKVDRMRKLGAKVVESGDHFDEPAEPLRHMRPTTPRNSWSMAMTSGSPLAPRPWPWS